MSASATSNTTAKLSGDEIPFNKHVSQYRTLSDWITDILIAALLVLIVFIVIYPLWFIVIASISDPAAVTAGQVTIFPKDVTLAGYQKVFSDSRIWIGYRNTVIYSIVGTALNMIVTLPGAFALSRREFKPRRVMLFLLTFTMYFSGGIIPSYLLFKSLGLLDSMLVFIVPGAVSVWNLIIARSFFESSIPEDLRDAARIDGLGYFGYFLRIVLPLSSAIIAVIGLYYFVGHWNDYFTGLMYIRTYNKQSLQVILQGILLANQTQQGGATVSGSGFDQQLLADQIKYGVIIVSTLPLLILYPFLQKYFNKGVMIGAVKG